MSDETKRTEAIAGTINEGNLIIKFVNLPPIILKNIKFLCCVYDQ